MLICTVGTQVLKQMIAVNVFYKATYDAKIRLKLCTGDFTGPARSLDV